MRGKGKVDERGEGGEVVVFEIGGRGRGIVGKEISKKNKEGEEGDQK